MCGNERKRRPNKILNENVRGMELMKEVKKRRERIRMGY